MAAVLMQITKIAYLSLTGGLWMRTLGTSGSQYNVIESRSKTGLLSLAPNLVACELQNMESQIVINFIYSSTCICLAEGLGLDASRKYYSHVDGEQMAQH